MIMRWQSVRSGVIGLIGSILMCTSMGLASQVAVQPIQMHFAKPGQSSVLTLSNQTNVPVRLQITGFAWKQNPDGSMNLTPTDDLVFFPTLVTVPGGETRSVRVAITAPPDTNEKSYRIFVEELPSLESQLSSNGGPSVYVRTKFGIPIFVDPLQSVQKPQITNVAVTSRELAFQVANDGTQHFVITKASIVGYSGGTPTFQRDLGGWYVLPGGERSYSVPLRDCSNLQSIKVRIETTAGNLEKSVDAATAGCRK